MLRWGARPQPPTSFFGEEGGCRFVLCPIYPPYDHVWWWGTKGDRRISTKLIRWLSIFQVSTWLPTKWFNGFKVCETQGRTVRGYLKEGQAQNHDCGHVMLNIASVWNQNLGRSCNRHVWKYSVKAKIWLTNNSLFQWRGGRPENRSWKVGG